MQGREGFKDDQVFDFRWFGSVIQELFRDGGTYRLGAAIDLKF